MTRATTASLLLVAAGLSATSASCVVDRETQITIALAAETEIPKELDAFSMRVFSTRTGELRFTNEWYPTSGREFPTTLAVIPADEDSLASPLRIELEARQGGVTFLRRESVISYVEGRNILLSMPLRMACFQFRDCGPNATCAGGQCVPSTVDAASAVDFDPKYVFPTDGGCFDEEACLASPIEVDVAEDCSFALPPGAPADAGNVAIRWAAAPSRVLALDADDRQEGWERTAADRGRLSQGACDSHLRRLGPDGEPLVPDWAQKVYFSRACAPKTKLTPYCFSTRTQHSGIGALVP